MDTFNTVYSIREAADKVDAPQGTIRQWETDFEGTLAIPRDFQNARYYTDSEIEKLLHIKTMREKNISKPVIKDLLETWDELRAEKMAQPDQTESAEVLQSIQNVLHTLPEVREAIVSEIRQEIRDELKREVTEDIYKATASNLREESAYISEQINELSKAYKADMLRQRTMLSEQFQGLSEAYKAEVTRRDEALMENINLMNELKALKDEKKKPFYKKLLGI